MKAFIICVLIGAGLPGAIGVYALTSVAVHQTQQNFDTVTHSARFVVADSSAQQSSLASISNSLLEELDQLDPMGEAESLFVATARAEQPAEDSDEAASEAIVEPAHLVFANSKVVKITLAEVPAATETVEAEVAAPAEADVKVASIINQAHKESCDSHKAVPNMPKARSSYKT